MKKLWNNSNYGNDIAITRADAINCSRSGDNSSAILDLLKKPYIKKQVETLNPEQLAKELKDYGAWDSEELKNHNENIIRWLWISCGDIVDRLTN